MRKTPDGRPEPSIQSARLCNYYPLRPCRHWLGGFMSWYQTFSKFADNRAPRERLSSRLTMSLTTRRWLLLLSVVAVAACSHVHPYPVLVGPPQYPLIVAPAGVTDWDSGLAEQLHTTSEYCAQIRHAVIREAEQHRDQAATRRNWFGAIAALAAALVAAYADADTELPEAIGSTTGNGN